MKVKIFDLDGCISDDTWRHNTIIQSEADPFKKYHYYHCLSFNDAYVNPDEVRMMPPDCRMVVITARPIMYRKITEDWLKQHHLDPVFLIMRNNDDHRGAALVKSAALKWLLDANSYDVKVDDIIEAIDDRPDVLEAYRRGGVRNVRHVAVNNDYISAGH